MQSQGRTLDKQFAGTNKATGNEQVSLSLIVQSNTQFNPVGPCPRDRLLHASDLDKQPKLLRVNFASATHWRRAARLGRFGSQFRSALAPLSLTGPQTGPRPSSTRLLLFLFAFKLCIGMQ